MTEEERNLDLLVGELEHENRLVRARNARLESEVAFLNGLVSKLLKDVELSNSNRREETSSFLKQMFPPENIRQHWQHAPAEDTEGGSI